MVRGSSTLALLGVVALLGGCGQPNPAFDLDVGGETRGTEDGSTTKTTGDGDGDPTTGGDGDGDPTSGDGDGDPTTGDGDLDTGMEAPIESDMGPDACVVETHPPLRPRYGVPENFDGGVCPDGVQRYVKLWGQANGDWFVTECSPGCETCQPYELTIGVTGLTLANLIPPPNMINPDLSLDGCYYVEAEEPLPGDDSGCYYVTMGIHGGEGPQTPMRFNANRDSWGLSPTAHDQLGGWTPDLLEQADADQCLCDELGSDCCPGQTVIAYKYELEPNVFVYPGNTGVVHLGNATPYTFIAAQAQGGTNCEIDPETSWALLRQP